MTELSPLDSCPAAMDPTRAPGPGGRSVPRKKVVLPVTGAGAFMGPYDVSALSVALPSIGDSLNVDLSSLNWIPVAALVPSAVLLIFCGRLGDMKGRKNLCSLGVGLFTAASLLSSLSQNRTELISFRVVQGAAGALRWSNSLATVTETFSARERGKAVGVYVMSLYPGLSVGPVLALRRAFVLCTAVALLGLLASPVRGRTPSDCPADNPRGD